ncbi:pseudouridine synthase [Phyllosticta capitalensis]|uniref:pseudouridine synthase n=1 Tax=Phyllosticta capitalensis TaxID=121624 RepID=UPI003130EC5C
METKSWTDQEFLSRRDEIEQRLARVSELEQKLAQKNATYSAADSPNVVAAAAATAPSVAPLNPQVLQKKPKPPPKPFDPSRYSTRLIAIKFAYLGGNYYGFEHHANSAKPLPTIEEEMWKALKKTRLIFPTPKEGVSDGDVNWDGCDYSKCGRTDRGVSAFGQVIAIRVRSSQPKPKPKQPNVEDGQGVDTAGEGVEEEEPSFDDIRDELPYTRMLNSVLPPDIRVLAWCPNPGANFSARFNCKERRYKYFFTNPAFGPMFGSAGVFDGSNGRKMREGWLDIEAMKEAASYLVGSHDFRNLCKVDPAKQITNFTRRIFHASIEKWTPGSGLAKYTNSPALQPSGLSDDEREEVTGLSNDSVDANGPGVFVFNVHGSAFLWHQVRHLIAVLFLVGQGLEKPTIVKELLDVETNPTKPKYEMAADAPLVLWDCLFPNLEEGKESDHAEESRPDSLNWIYVGDDRIATPNGSKNASGLGEKFGKKGVIEDLWQVWHSRRIDEVLAGSLLDLIASQGPQPPAESLDEAPAKLTRSDRVYDGSDGARLVGKYVPVMKKERMEPVEVINSRYLARKGLNPKDVSKDNEADE